MTKKGGKEDNEDASHVPLGRFMEKLGATMNLHLNYSFFPGTGLRQQIERQPKPINTKDAFYMGLGFSLNV